MKAKVLLDGGRPKVRPEELRGMIVAAGIKVGDRSADIAVVVGGDGMFSRYGRTEEIPLLFVGVRSSRPTGSKAVLAEAFLDELPHALHEVSAGNYHVQEHRRLLVMKNGKSIGEVFTDAYLQRGADSNCLRYRLKASGEGARIDESAIGDGVVISTSAGASGYYSYPDRIREGMVDPAAKAIIGEDEVGICHINPTYTERADSEDHPLRYKVPWGSVVSLSLTRRADARLYGTTKSRSGVKIGPTDKITIAPARRTTKVIVIGGRSD